MLLPERDMIKKILVTELGYSFNEADFYVDHYPALHDRMAEALQTWLQDRRVLDIEVEGITVRQVMQAHSCHFLNALRELSELLTRPLNPGEKEALKAFLRSPVARL